MATPEPARIAHYQVTGTLGEGGMGVVYRATDTKVGREVALKVLTPAFADDPERLARFAREARVLAFFAPRGGGAVYQRRVSSVPSGGRYGTTAPAGRSAESAQRTP